MTAVRSPWTVTFAALVVALAVVAAALALGDGAVEQARLAARWTARVGFPVFIVTYSASSLYRLWPSDRTRELLRLRRWWGLGFAATHTIHLVALVTFFRITGTRPDAVTVVGGGLAYALLYAMALTSNQAAMRALGRNWKRLHTVGIHWLWVVFASSYAGRIFDPERETIGLIFAPIAFAALGALLAHITGDAEAETYQPMNVNFGLFPPLPDVKKKARKHAYTERAKADLGRWLHEAAPREMEGIR